MELMSATSKDTLVKFREVKVEQEHKNWTSSGFINHLASVFVPMFTVLTQFSAIPYAARDSRNDRED